MMFFFFFIFIHKYIFLLTSFSIFEDSASHRNCKYEKLKKGFMLRVLFDIFYGSSSTGLCHRPVALVGCGQHPP